MGPSHVIAIGLAILAVLHWLVYPRLSEKLSYETLQIMATIYLVGAVILWFLPA